MKEKYFLESIGEVVNQVYEIQAKSWEEAKEKAFPQMETGDRLIYGSSEIVKEYPYFRGYHYIDDSKAVKIATLEKGAWLPDEKNGGDYWDEDAYYWSDEPEYFFYSIDDLELELPE